MVKYKYCMNIVVEYFEIKVFFRLVLIDVIVKLRGEGFSILIMVLSFVIFFLKLCSLNVMGKIKKEGREKEKKKIVCVEFC